MKSDMQLLREFLCCVLLLVLWDLEACNGGFIRNGTIETFIKTSGSVNQMEADQYIPGNILFSDSNAVKTVNEKGEIAPVAGVATMAGNVDGKGALARFKYIGGFIQINKISIVVVDSDNSCLRHVDRITGSTSSFVGGCQSYTMFNFPLGIIADSRNGRTLLLADCGNKVIWSVDILTKTASHVPGSRAIPCPSNLLMASDDKSFYITYRHGVAVYNTSTSKYKVLTGASLSGFFDGNFTQARFSNPKQITSLNTSTIVVADQNNNRLRVLDLETQTVRSVCTGVREHKDGGMDDCRLNWPSSLMLHSDGLLYVGENGYIRRMRGYW